MFKIPLGDGSTLEAYEGGVALKRADGSVAFDFNVLADGGILGIPAPDGESAFSITFNADGAVISSAGLPMKVAGNLEVTGDLILGGTINPTA